MTREEFATLKMREYVKKNSDKFKAKYGLSWYNDHRVLSAQKREYKKVWDILGEIRSILQEEIASKAPYESKMQEKILLSCLENSEIRLANRLLA